MNIQSILSIAKKLEDLGFDASIGNELLKRTSFKPASFTISQSIQRGKDVITFQLFFQKEASDNYSCICYDAHLRKEIEIPTTTIEGIDVFKLEERMNSIDWKNFFSLTENLLNKKENALAGKMEETVEGIVSDLQRLGSVDEGKEIADCLKMKYWCDTPVQEMISNLVLLKSKLEICQRFYFFQGQDGISAEEAYRFLHNRWLEKQLQVKKKQMDQSGKTEDAAIDIKNGKTTSLRKSRTKAKRSKNH